MPRHRIESASDNLAAKVYRIGLLSSSNGRVRRAAASRTQRGAARSGLRRGPQLRVRAAPRRRQAGAAAGSCRRAGAAAGGRDRRRHQSKHRRRQARDHEDSHCHGHRGGSCWRRVHREPGAARRQHHRRDRRRESGDPGQEPRSADGNGPRAVQGRRFPAGRFRQWIRGGRSDRAKTECGARRRRHPGVPTTSQAHSSQ